MFFVDLMMIVFLKTAFPFQPVTVFTASPASIGTEQ